MRKCSLGLMSYKEIGAIPKDRSVLLLPIGCVEQHGPAGFTGADTILAEYLCRRTAEGLEDVYVAPPIWFGYTAYAAFPGTVSLRLETLRAVVRDSSAATSHTASVISSSSTTTAPTRPRSSLSPPRCAGGMG